MLDTIPSKHIFEEVVATVARMFLSHLSQTDEPTRFFNKLSQESGASCKLQPNSTQWYIHGNLENIARAFKIMSIHQTCQSQINSSDTSMFECRDTGQTVETMPQEESMAATLGPIETNGKTQKSNIDGENCLVMKELASDKVQGDNAESASQVENMSAQSPGRIVHVKVPGLSDKTNHNVVGMGLRTPEDNIIESTQTIQQPTNSLMPDKDGLQESWPQSKDLKSVPCPECRKNFTKESNMYRHLRSSHQGMAFNCEKCEKVFTRKVALEKHEQIIHGNRQCTRCLETFATKATLAKHKCARSRETLACNICGKRYSKAGGLAKHRLLEHSSMQSNKLANAGKEQTFVCPICSLSFLHEQDCLSHMKTFHPACSVESPNTNTDMPCAVQNKDNPNIGNLEKHPECRQTSTENVSKPCPVCGKTFGRVGNLNKHIRLIHEKVRFKCDQCPEAFKQRPQLERHVKVVHEGLTYPCRLCNSTYPSRKKLARHQEEEHKRLALDGVVQCEHCGKSFLHDSNLWHHIKRVHEGRRFKCTMCEKDFCSKQKMMEHKSAQHDGERFQCSLCSKTFSRKEKLREHNLSVHTKEKPLECKLCGEHFARASALSYHSKRAHSSEEMSISKDKPNQMARKEGDGSEKERKQLSVGCSLKIPSITAPLSPREGPSQMSVLTPVGSSLILGSSASCTITNSDDKTIQAVRRPTEKQVDVSQRPQQGQGQLTYTINSHHLTELTTAGNFAIPPKHGAFGKTNTVLQTGAVESSSVPQAGPSSHLSDPSNPVYDPAGDSSIAGMASSYSGQTSTLHASSTSTQNLSPYAVPVSYFYPESYAYYPPQTVPRIQQAWQP